MSDKIVRGISRVSHAERRAQLAARLREKRLLSAPGVFEMVSAKIADRMGFEALYLTGYGTVASYLGLPDAGLASYSDMVNRVQQFASITATPMICDGDTGYGGLLNVMHTVRGYEAAGACAIQLEDQEFPKKCGHMLGRRVIDAQAMVDKIRVAVESRSDPNFLIIARTDARATEGLDAALERAALYAEHGADITFVEAPQSTQELGRIASELAVPQLVNVVIGGKTPALSTAEFAHMGFGLVLYANAALQGALKGMTDALTHLRDKGRLDEDSALVASFAQRQRLVNKPLFDELDRQYRAD
jgi:2-methylisocitrate lyase-like PEP mutase family enzyme